jgi:hypothetical protein
MTAFARKVLSSLPAPTGGGTANNYTILQEFTNDTDKAGGKIDLQVAPGLSMFGRYGWRDLATFDQPGLPLPAGGDGNGTIYAKSTQLALGMTWVQSPTRLLEVRFGYGTTEAGKDPPTRFRRRPGNSAGRDRPRSRAYRLQTHGHGPVAGTNWVACPRVEPEINYTWLSGVHSEITARQHRVQDEPALWRLPAASSAARPAPPPSTSPTSASLHALSNAGRRHPQAWTSPTATWHRDATVNLGVRYDAPLRMGGQQRVVELRPVQDDGDGEERLMKDRSTINQSQQLRACSASRGPSPTARWSAAATASATCTSTAPAAATCCRSTVRR